ncbi:MAG: hypothetical protein RL199_431, partial [Pseudomonadota bacterium]
MRLSTAFTLALSLAGPAVARPVVSPGPGMTSASSTETYLVELATGPRASDVDAIARARARLTAAVTSGGVGRVARVYTHLPYLGVVAARDGGLESLAKLPGVRRVHRRGFHQALSDEAGLALVRQPEAIRRGVTGEGTAVAVIDTGADYTHPDLGGCSAPGEGEGCRVAVAEDVTADDDELLDGFMRHGTNVASIVAAVAPKTRLLV